MADDLSSLGEDDLNRLLQVIESLERSAFDFLQLEVGGMKVVLGKGDPADYRIDRPSGSAATGRVPASPVEVGEEPVVPAGPEVAASRGPSGPAVAVPATEASQPVRPTEAGTIEVRAPMMGIFYAQPEPGAAPYVAVGAVVQAETTVGLVEVMKMFNAVTAGVEGTVVAVLAENNQLVEYGQPLFRVKTA